MLIGREMSGEVRYLLRRASDELEVHSSSGVFERLAGPYVSIFGVPEIGAQVRVSHAVRAVPRDARRILDVGCGPGLLLGALRSRFPQGEIVGIEIDPAAASVATHIHPQCTIVTGDFVAEAVNFSGFDAVCNVDVMEHIAESDVLPFMQRLLQTLRPGGTLVMHVPATMQRRHFKRFLTWEHHDHEREGFSKDELIALVREAGFASVALSGTFGYWGSLAWELNMLVAGNPVQALVYPPTLVLAALDSWTKSAHYNGWLLTAVRPT